MAFSVNMLLTTCILYYDVGAGCDGDCLQVQ